MKITKLGTIFLICTIALSGASVGYALWFQDLHIEGEVHTGVFCVGVRNVLTGDSGPNFVQPGGNLYPGNIPDDGTPDPSSNYFPFYWNDDILGNNFENKNIASTISINGEYKCTHDGIDFYEDVTEQVWNAYPWYCSWISLEFANCGSIPAKIADGYFDVIDDPDGIMNFLKIDEIQIYTDEVYRGLFSPDILDGFQYQLDPCHTLEIVIYFHFEEEWADDGGTIHIMPQGKAMSFTYLIKWAQWNEVLSTVTIP